MATTTSSVTSSGAISFSGLSSGMDTDSIITQLLAIDQKPMTLLQTKQSNLQAEQTAVTQVNALVTSLQSASSALESASLFTQSKATVGDTTVATANALTGAQSGTHTLQVKQLAKASTVGSTTKSSQTDALGVSGQFVVNGQAIKVTSDDSLQSLATKINNASANVTATVVQPSTGTYRLVLTNKYTGSQPVSLSDVGSGTILSSTLGLTSAGTASPAHSITGGYASDTFSSSGKSIATMMGMTSASSGTVQINGTDVSIDLGTDTLTTIATKISTATGLKATVASVTDPNTGSTVQRLEIQGATSFTDSNNVLANLGVVQNSLASGASLVTGQDASFVLDGVPMTRTSNTVSDALSNVTLYLQSDKDTPTTQITIATDTSSVKTALNSLVSAYNSLVNKVSDYTAYDADTKTSGVLFGDSTIRSMMDDLAEALTGQVSGVSTDMSALSQIGISLDTTGQLSIDSDTLDTALTDRFADVKKLLQSSGSATDSAVTYVGSTAKTVASGNAAYSIYVSQPATQATLTASMAHVADDNSTYEVLTFSGIAFNSVSRGISIAPNSSLDDIVSQINGDSSVSQYVTASKVDNQLVLTSSVYGSAGSFTVKSSQAAATNNSGIGSSTLVTSGKDIEGTVNGESMTGSGQMLIGTTGNKTTEGLQLKVTASTDGYYGTVSVSNGLAALADTKSRMAVDTTDGSLTTLSTSLGDQISDLTDEIAAYKERLANEETYLRQQFTAMESAVAQLKSASSSLSALTSSTTSS